MIFFYKFIPHKSSICTKPVGLSHTQLEGVVGLKEQQVEGYKKGYIYSLAFLIFIFILTKYVYN